MIRSLALIMILRPPVHSITRFGLVEEVGSNVSSHGEMSEVSVTDLLSGVATPLAATVTCDSTEQS